MRRVSGLIGICFVLVAAPVHAQRGSRPAASTARPAAVSPAEAKALAIRAELADVLLQSQRYSEAAREYARLVDADSTNTRYRLGLAQALAWGGRYRDAERELRRLAIARPRDVSVDTLLRAVRQSMQPRSREAAEWVREQPRYTPYRYALARALVRERQPRVALVHYDSLLVLGATPSLLREMTDAHRAAGDLRGGISLLQAAVARSPSDTAVRRAYSALLAEGRQFDAALAQNDTVLLWGRSAMALVERARIDIAREDLDAAVNDLRASVAITPTEEAWLALGDIYRWRGDFADARSSYDEARAMNPSSRQVTARFGQLARDERPAVLFGTPIDVEAGWLSAASFAADRVGTRYSTLSVLRGFAAPFALVGSTRVELRDLRERLSSGAARTTGYAADVALARGASRGALYGEVSAKGGAVYHPDAGSRPFGAVAITARYYAWAATAELAGGPAYPSLMTTAFLTPADAGGPWLVEHTVTGSLAGPIGLADAGVSIRRSDFNDGNRRTVVQAYGRYPLSRRISTIYSGNAIAFANRSPLYWDPDSHVANAVGIQVADRRRRGWSYSATVLPGTAWSEATPYVRESLLEAQGNRLRIQLSATGELAYRARGWEATAAYGWGRLGSYERSDARVAVRVLP